jgi:septation ring formation regulator EzrA
MIFRRARYAEAIERQLDLFEREDADLLDDVDRALERYNAADRDEAEELYGDYQLAIEAATDRLAELRDTYARTLEHSDGYVRQFNRAAVQRWRALSLTIDD